MMKQLLFLTFTILMTSAVLDGQEGIFGKWKTIDDDGQTVKSIVEIFEKDGMAYGKVLEIFREAHEDQDPVCEFCKGERKGQKVIGMQVLENMKKDGESWEGGKILDPENGKIYTCKLWLDDGDLKVRGYIAFLYRTQTWKRVE